ncbi:MAG: type II toxin-antitoxin system Phd/YefM family antitoxin [Planctomycetes bacterium]|nr:type II toxin-antitoxin system Phd/YefM family antitoxin [Planctomycetota bacterium]
MKFVTLRDLKINPSKVVECLGREDVVVTRHGKPAAALVFLDEDLLDDFILLHHPTFLKEVESARAEYLRRGGIGHSAMKKRIERRRG